VPFESMEKHHAMRYNTNILGIHFSALFGHDVSIIEHDDSVFPV